MRKTKIIATIGPASSDAQTFAAMCRAGLNVARLNFSHSTHAEHQEKIDMIKRVREELGLPIAIMLDTKGPEYRIRTFEKGRVQLADGAEFTFTTRDIVGDEHIVGVNYAGLPQNLRAGDTILVNNGLVSFQVTAIEGTEIHCRVENGGELSDRKSMSFPGKVFDHEYLSAQDRDDLLFGIENDVDFVAASFVSRKQDVLDLKNFLAAHGGEHIDVIAKIENRSGVDHIEEICEACELSLIHISHDAGRSYSVRRPPACRIPTPAPRHRRCPERRCAARPWSGCTRSAHPVRPDGSGIPRPAPRSPRGIST